MQRRDFIILGAAGAALVPFSANAVGAHYEPGLVDRELAAGKTVLVDFFAHWCPPCRVQTRLMRDLRAENPTYGEAISFVEVDWDTYHDDELARRLEIPTQATLVVLKGDEELGRVVFETERAKIKALLDTALEAATA